MPLRRAWLCLLTILAVAPRVPAELPPVPVPPENPLTEPKRVLGKILFWDEQLSADDSIACGTCHRPAYGGADPRAGRYLGTDKGTIDDVRGSPGMPSFERGSSAAAELGAGAPPALQVTPRLAPSYFGALWADEVFWDGRATSTFKDPVTGATAIARGGALESQVAAALSSSAEMADPNRTWQQLAAKLARVAPLALATNLPADVAAALAARPTYPALFAAAFGAPDIDAKRIAFAIATYERTLVSDETAWDRYQAGDQTALGERAQYGLRALQSFRCVACHTPPLFTNNDFFQIGVRRADFDRGREAVTHDPEDAGEMKVPTLRNAALRPRFMHTGEFTSIGAAVGFYVTAPALPERDGIPGAGLYAFNMSRIDESDIREFLEKGLVDERVRNETFPFDRPTLRSERAAAPER